MVMLASCADGHGHCVPPDGGPSKSGHHWSCSWPSSKGGLWVWVWVDGQNYLSSPGMRMEVCTLFCVFQVLMSASLFQT